MIKKNKIVIQSEKVGDSFISYIYLQDFKKKSLQSNQQMIIDGKEVKGGEDFKGDLVVDLDKDGKIIGIEIRGNIVPDDLLN
jgi:uncharacterized protein YuzE